MSDTINQITAGLSKPYFRKILIKLGQTNEQNANTICNYILAEQAEINIKNSTKEGKIKVLIWLSNFLDEKKIPEEIVSQLHSIASRQKNVWFYIAMEEEREEKEKLVNLVTEGDRIQMSDKRFRRELASWTHSNRSSMRDGMPGYAFGFDDIMSLMGPFIIRTFAMGKGQAAKDKDLALGSLILIVIGTDSDNVKDWLNTGLVLSNTLLYLTSENIWCSFLNQPIEVSELRNRLGNLIYEHRNQYPQILLRIGYSKDNDEVKPTPRRNVEQVLL